MKITTSYMSNIFQELNEKYFDGTLKTPDFRVTHCMDTLGQYIREGLSSEIRMSDVYDMDDRTLKETMLHEMIHLKIDQFYIKDNASHGKAFMKEANRINEFGWNITPLGDSSGFEINEGTIKKKTVYVCFDNRGCIAIAAERGSEKIVEANLRKHGCRKIKKIFTDDPAFAKLPSCRTSLTGKRLSENEIYEIENRLGIDII